MDTATEMLMTPFEVSQRLRVSLATVWKWCREDGLGRRFGSVYRISEEDLERFAQQGRPAGLRGTGRE